MILLLLLGGYGSGQATDWTEMAPTASPTEQHYHDMAYDSESDRAILFGGQRIGASSDETWSYNFNTNTWTLMNPPTSPSARFMHAMAYDAESDRVILFGGIFHSEPETWAYDFNADMWTNMSPALQPGNYVLPGMVYDSESDRMILFGGDAQNSFIRGPFTDETWSYDFNTDTWTLMSPDNSPSPRGGVGMAYDIESDRAILFGGGAALFGDLGETWAYDLNSDTWEEMNPQDEPFPRHEPGMAYDARSDRVVLFGGSGGQDETWIYDVNEDAWIQTEKGTGPPRRRVTGLTYDAESERIIMFGGVQPVELDQFYGDTWSYKFTPLPGPDSLPPWVWIAVGAAAVGAVGLVVYFVRRQRLRSD